MNLPFAKYHGAGNDFIIIDHRTPFFEPKQELIASLCHRRFGIGADGMIFIENSDNHLFRMKYYNSDGLEGSMCGNGGRCAAAFIADLGLGDKRMNFEASDGSHQAVILEREGNISLVMLQMADVEEVHQHGLNYYLNTGSPHHVEFVDDVHNMDVFSKGSDIRYNAEYAPEGVNVNFVQVMGKGLFVRTYERGVEEETLSCGTGVTASALAFAITHPELDHLSVQTRGGTLILSFKRDGNAFREVWLEGPAVMVYGGLIPINE